MPSTVAIAPGPNISGIASGTNATVSPGPVGAFGMMEAVPLLGMNSAKPIRVRMMPPTIRTMLSGTSKIFSSNAPKIRKKNSRTSGVEAGLPRNASVCNFVLTFQKLQKHW